MKPLCQTLINYLKPMKKLSKYLMLIVFITFVFQSCIETPSYPKYYQIKNETGTELFIKFYYSVKTNVKQYDSFNLKNNESSEEFYAMLGGIGSHSSFIYITDSLDIYSNGKMIRREKLGKAGMGCPSKSLYCEDNYNTIIKSEKGHDVHVYRMLKSDFE